MKQKKLIIHPSTSLLFLLFYSSKPRSQVRILIYRKWSIITFPPRCAISALSLSKISSVILCPGAARSFWSAPKGAATGPENAFPARLRSLLWTAHARRGAGWGGGLEEIAFGRLRSMYFCDVCPVHHIWINYFVICMIYELSSARVWSGVCRHAEPLSHYPTWQVEPMVESNQLIWVEFNCSKRRTIHAPISK